MTVGNERFNAVEAHSVGGVAAAAAGVAAWALFVCVCVCVRCVYLLSYYMRCVCANKITENVSLD